MGTRNLTMSEYCSGFSNRQMAAYEVLEKKVRDAAMNLKLKAQEEGLWQ